MHDRWHSFFSVFFDRMNDRYKRGIAQDCFLARFLAEPDVGRWSHVDSVGIVAEILSTGTETTIASVHWFFHGAIFFPEAMKLAQQELDEVVGRDRLPQWEDRPNLPYVEALIQELHRWSSLTPLAVSHATTDADSYRGVTVPRGATVIANTYAAHHDAGTYPRPEKFAPARFLPADHPWHDAELATLQKDYAFGVGRRACPGLQVANASLFIVISRVLWGFDIGAAPSGPPRLETSEQAQKTVLIYVPRPLTLVPEAASPLVVAPAPFDCSVTVRDEKAKELIAREAATLKPPQGLESASVYDELVRDWVKQNPL